MKKTLVSIGWLCLMLVAALCFSIQVPAATVNRNIGFDGPTLAKVTNIRTKYALPLSSNHSSQIAVPGARFRHDNSSWRWGFHRHHRRGGGSPTPTPEPSVLTLLGLGVGGIVLRQTKMFTNLR